MPLAWQIADVGDLDGDGRADLVWRNTETGGLAAWIMNGLTVAPAVAIATTVPLAWQIAGVGDLDGDGRADLVWRNTENGAVAAWFMNGLTFMEGAGSRRPCHSPGRSPTSTTSTETDGPTWCGGTRRRELSPLGLSNGLTFMGGGGIASNVPLAWRIR